MQVDDSNLDAGPSRGYCESRPAEKITEQVARTTIAELNGLLERESAKTKLRRLAVCPPPNLHALR